ncbi:MAG: hypothetical protein C0600_13060, partial [Ignavibacteria bacterium]
MKKTVCTTVLTFLLLAAVPLLAQNPNLVRNINASTDESVQILNSRAILDGVLYFNGNDGSGTKLWRTDGTSAGTWMVKDLPPDHLVTLNNHLYFVADNGIDPGIDPWVSDGSTLGTLRLNNLAVGKRRTKWVWNLTATSSQVYFTYAVFNFVKSISEYQLWKTDGTVSGTAATGVTLDGIENTTPEGTRLLMFAGDGATGEEPWISDGTGQGTNLILDICPLNSFGTTCEVEYYPSTVDRNIYASKIFPVGVNGEWFFSKSDNTTGEELWRTDGTASGTTLVQDINPGSESACPNFFVELNGTLYFAADDGTNGMELWKYPLPNGPASMVKDIASGSADSEPIWLTPLDGILYFSAWSSEGGREFWKSDGTTTGTVQVKDIAVGSASSNPDYDKLVGPAINAQDYWRRFTVLGEKLYFAADDGAGFELWESDGSALGTVKTADINPNVNEGSTPRYITAAGNRVLFIAYHPSYGNEWWVYYTGSNIPPIASANAAPTSGTAPLLVSFDGSGSSDPDGTITGYVWDFGDGIGSSTQMSPSYTYTNAGTYTAQLTVTDDTYATGVDDVTITVTSSGTYVYVANQAVSRVVGGGNKIHAEDVVLIRDNVGQAVSGANVSASYTGPTSGTVSGTTGSSGEVTLESSWIRNPNGTWCFTITDVQASGKTYNSS